MKNERFAFVFYIKNGPKTSHVTVSKGLIFKIIIKYEPSFSEMRARCTRVFRQIEYFTVFLSVYISLYGTKVSRVSAPARKMKKSAAAASMVETRYRSVDVIQFNRVFLSREIVQFTLRQLYVAEIKRGRVIVERAKTNRFGRRHRH